MVDQNIHQSDIEINPSRYILLSGNGPSPRIEQTGTVYEKDPNAYYPYDNPNIQRTVSTPRVNPEAKMRYGSNSVYQLDQKPYYGSNGDYRVVYDMPQDKLAVPIEFGDLTRTHANESNIKKLETELNNLNQGENVTNAALTGKYIKDSTAYYDPTLHEKIHKKIQLVQTIKEMKEALLHPNKPVIQTVLEPKKYGPPKVQNFVNKNKEETNNFINRSYYYPIQKDKNGFDVAGPIGSNERQIILDTGDVSYAEGKIKTLEALKQDGSVIGAEPKNTRKPVLIIPPGEVLGTPVTEIVAGSKPSKPQSTSVSTPQSNSQITPEIVPELKTQSTRQSGPSKYVVEPNEKSKTFVEADSVGEILGNKYVQEKIKQENKIFINKSKSADKTVVVNDVQKVKSTIENRQDESSKLAAVSNDKNNESVSNKKKLNIKTTTGTNSENFPKGVIPSSGPKKPSSDDRTSSVSSSENFPKGVIPPSGPKKPSSDDRISDSADLPKGVIPVKGSKKPQRDEIATHESSNVSQAKTEQIKNEESLKNLLVKNTNEIKPTETIQKSEQIKKKEDSVNQDSKTDESKSNSKTEVKSELKKEENKTEVKKEQPKIEIKTHTRLAEDKNAVNKESPKKAESTKNENPIKNVEKTEIKEEEKVRPEQKTEIKKEKIDDKKNPDLRKEENKEASKKTEVKLESSKKESKQEVKKQEPIQSGHKPEIKKEELKNDEVKTEENKQKPNLRKDEQLDEESRTESEKNSSSESEHKSSEVQKQPNTQGLKIEKIKIIPMRKLLSNNTEKSAEEKKEKE